MPLPQLDSRSASGGIRHRALEVVQDRQQALQRGDVGVARLLGALLFDASAIVDEVGLGALRQAQVLVGFLFDLGQFGAQRLEVVGRGRLLGASGWA